MARAFQPSSRAKGKSSNSLPSNQFKAHNFDAKPEETLPPARKSNPGSTSRMRSNLENIPIFPKKSESHSHTDSGTIKAAKYKSSFETRRQLIPNNTGQPLPESVRQQMESAFGTDFSDVRVHQGPEAEAIGAKAFTKGKDIFVPPDQYSPTSTAGQKLLGHELAHVVQQRSGKVKGSYPSGLNINDSPELEAEADKLGAKAARKERINISESGKDTALAKPTSNSTQAIQGLFDNWRRKRRINRQTMKTPYGMTWGTEKPMQIPLHDDKGAFKKNINITKQEAADNRLMNQFIKKNRAERKSELIDLAMGNLKTSATKITDDKYRENKGIEAAEIEGIKAPLPYRNRTPLTQDTPPVSGKSNTFKTDLSAHLIKTGRAKAGVKAGFTRQKLTGAERANQRLRAKPEKQGGMGMGKLSTTTRRTYKHNRKGGPDDAIREQYQGKVLARMELATNQNKLEDSITKELKAAGKNQKQIDTAINKALMDPANPGKARTSHDLHAEIGNFNKGAVKANIVRPAHFYGRHGAQTTREDQISRITSGVYPDEKPDMAKYIAAPPAAPTVQVKDPANPAKKLNLPNYTKRGSDKGGRSAGGFATHQSQLFAIEEGLAQAWNRVGSEKTSRTNQIDLNMKYKLKQKDPITNKYPKKWQGAYENQPMKLDPTWKGQRFSANVTLPKPGGKKNVPLFDEGFGESFHSKVKKNVPNPLTAADIQKRAGNIQSEANQQDARVIMDRDAKRGGFSLVTAYAQGKQKLRDANNKYDPNTVYQKDIAGKYKYKMPDTFTTSELTGTYKDKVWNTVRKDKAGNIIGKPTTKVRTVKDAVIPEVKHDRTTQEDLDASLKQITDKGKAHVWDKPTKKVNEVQGGPYWDLQKKQWDWLKGKNKYQNIN